MAERVKTDSKTLADLLREQAGDAATDHKPGCSICDELRTLRSAADEIERLQGLRSAAQVFMDDVLAEEVDKNGIRHYDLAFRGGPVGDLFNALEDFNNV